MLPQRISRRPHPYRRFAVLLQPPTTQLGLYFKTGSRCLALYKASMLWVVQSSTFHMLTTGQSKPPGLLSCWFSQLTDQSQLGLSIKILDLSILKPLGGLSQYLKHFSSTPHMLTTSGSSDSSVALMSAAIRAWGTRALSNFPKPPSTLYIQ